MNTAEIVYAKGFDYIYLCGCNMLMSSYISVCVFLIVAVNGYTEQQYGIAPKCNVPIAFSVCFRETTCSVAYEYDAGIYIYTL